MAALVTQKWAHTRLADAALFVVSIIALCVPALINTSPIVFFDDTRTYYTSGGTAIRKIVAMFHPGDGAAIEETLRMARGVRSGRTFAI